MRVCTAGRGPVRFRVPSWARTRNSERGARNYGCGCGTFFVHAEQDLGAPGRHEAKHELHELSRIELASIREIIRLPATQRCVERSTWEAKRVRSARAARAGPSQCCAMALLVRIRLDQTKSSSIKLDQSGSSRRGGGGGGMTDGVLSRPAFAPQPHELCCSRGVAHHKIRNPKPEMESASVRRRPQFRGSTRGLLLRGMLSPLKEREAPKTPATPPIQ
jgi:hypothetical protein